MAALELALEMVALELALEMAALELALEMAPPVKSSTNSLPNHPPGYTYVLTVRGIHGGGSAASHRRN